MFQSVTLLQHWADKGFNPYLSVEVGMDAALLSTAGGGLLRCCVAAHFPAFRPAIVARSIAYGREIATGGLLSSSGLRITCEGNRRGPPRRSNSSDRTSREANKSKDQTTSNGQTLKSPNQDEIIALFRRIQSSISKEGPIVSRKRSTSNVNEKQSIEPVQETLRKISARKEIKAPIREESRELPQSRERSEDKIPEVDSSSENFKVSRPLSKFVKKSPIPARATFVGKTKEAVEESLLTNATDDKLDFQNINEMKLSELKELAKSRGVKGYSKLKKGELLELLKGLLQSSS